MSDLRIVPGSTKRGRKKTGKKGKAGKSTVKPAGKKDNESATGFESGVGRPPVFSHDFAEMDQTNVGLMAYYGAPNTEIAEFYGVSEKAIRDNFSEILKQKRAERSFRLRMAQTEASLDGDTTMQIWRGKNELGQKDRVDHTTKGKPLLVTNAPYDEV